MIPSYDVHRLLAREGRAVVPGTGGVHRLREEPEPQPWREPSLLTLAWREYRAIVAAVTRGGAR